MKLSIVFCALALAAAVKLDGRDLKDLSDYQTCGAKSDKGGVAAEFTFSSGKNWNGDTGPRGNKLTSKTVKHTETYGKVDGRNRWWSMSGHHETIKQTWTATEMVACSSASCTPSECHSSYPCRDYPGWGSYCVAKIDGWWRYTQKYCYTEEKVKKSDTHAGGYCNIASVRSQSLNGHNQWEDMWVVAGSAVNNDGSLRKHVDRNTARDNKEKFKAGDKTHYCQIETDQTFTFANTECKIDLDIKTDGKMEKDDKTCISAVSVESGDTISRECKNGKQLGNGKTHDVHSKWFPADKEFKIALTAMTDGAYFNGLEIIFHDDVKLTCRDCAHPCDDGSHGCDTEHGKCVKDGASYQCKCKQGTECVKGCESPFKGHWCEVPKTHDWTKTQQPTKQPTANPTGCGKCVYTAFSEWTECSTKCGEGTQTRTRTVQWPASAHFAACGDFTCAKGADGDVDTETKKCHQSFCDQDCEMSEWSKWSHPDSTTPTDVLNIWNETVHGSDLHVHRVRSIIMHPTGPNAAACPATIEFKPWLDHCFASMGREKNERVCEMDDCTSAEDMTTCHHHADRCSAHAFTRVGVKYSKNHKCGDVGYDGTKTCNRYYGRLSGASLIHAECAVEDGQRYASSDKSASDAAKKVGGAQDPKDLPGKCLTDPSTWGLIVSGGKRYTTSTAAECKRDCVAHSECQAWTYKDGEGFCYLLGAEANTKAVLARAETQQGKWKDDFQSGMC